MRAIFSRSRRLTSNERRNSRTHIAQGVNPSKSPMTMVKSGSSGSPALRRPNQRVSTLLEGVGDGRVVSMHEESVSGRQAS